MDTGNLFKTQIFLLSLIGFKTTYGNNLKGKLQKLFAIYNWISGIINLSLVVHFMIKNLHDVETVVDLIVISLSNVFTFARLASFYVQRKDFEYLIEDLKNVVGVGNQIYAHQSCTCLMLKNLLFLGVTDKFERTIKRNYKITTFIFRFSTLTAFSLILKSILKNISNGTKSFPYKIV